MYRYNFPHRKEKRRAAALARQEAYSKLTDKQKLERLEAAGFTSGRQHTKLLIRINNKK